LWEALELSCFIAPKRLSNEFDCTIGAEPATCAGAGAAAAVPETDRFSAGLAVVCLASASGQRPSARWLPDAVPAQTAWLRPSVSRAVNGLEGILMSALSRRTDISDDWRNVC
jgi:hypothetical protein